MTQIRERMAATLAVAYFSTGVGQILNQAFFFLILRFLPVQGVGAYSLAVAVATIFAYIMDLGLAVFLVGELSQTHYRLKAVVQMVLYLRIPLLLLELIGLIIWSGWAHPASGEFWTVALITLIYVIQLIDVGLTPWFQVRQRQNTVNLVAMIVPLGRLLGIIFVLLFRHGLRLSDVIAVLLATQLMGTVSLLVLARRETGRRPERPRDGEADARQLLRRYWRRGPGLAVMYSLNVLQARLDWILVSSLISKIALANYSVANKIVELAMLIAGTWARTSFPWLANQEAGGAHVQFRLVLLRRLFVVSSGGLTVIMFFWSIPLVRLFFGSKYAEAELSIRLMTLGTVVFMLNQFFFYVVLGLKQERVYAVLIFTATAAQVLVDVVLLPRIGISGAAIGMLVMAAVMHAGQIVLLKRHDVMGGAELLRLELFVASVIGSAMLACWANIGLVKESLASLMVVGIFGAGFVLRPEDRALLSKWMIGRFASWCGTAISR